jgi:hypothetical protein
MIRIVTPLQLGFAALALAAAVMPALAGTVPGTTCPTFPDNSWWHADVSQLGVHPRSNDWMARMSSDRKLHPDFGDSFGDQPIPYGIPITVVDSLHPKVKVKFDIDDESDHVRYPLGMDIVVEGGQWNKGDRHTVVVNADNCRLYETWATRLPRLGSDKWRAGSGATWRLTSNKLRPDTWTSGDAAGFPILPGLLAYDEVLANTIDHAIRFTTDITDRSYLWPARHQAGSVNDPRFPPMGARFRLKASYVIAPSLRTDTKRVLQAMKKYGLALADNGTPWFFQGTVDDRWPNALLDQLKQVPASAFEAVDTLPLMISPDSMRVRRQH